MVQEENGIVGAAENVASIASDRKMACGMQSQEALVEATLKLVLEGFDVLGRWAEGNVVEILKSEPVRGGKCRLQKVSNCGA